MVATTVTLSCEQCRRRKTKCDKKSPCSACQQSGITCTAIQRPRRPRGRHARAKHNEDVINSRISQLEDLVRSFETRVEEESRQAEQIAALPPIPVKANALFAKDFFSAISQQVGGIREALEDHATDESEEEDASPDTSKTTPSDSSMGQSLTGTFLFDSSSAGYSTYQTPSESIRTTLIEVFRRRVDAVFKMVLMPAFDAAIRSRYTPDGASEAVARLVSFESIERAVYFVAVCVMSENEVKVMLRDDRSKLLAQFQRGTEELLIQSGLLRNPDKLVIEAFVFYLLGLRILKQYTVCWSLVPLAIRAATAIGLPIPNTPSGDEQNARVGLDQCRDEIYQRIWCCIGILDTLTSRDRGTRLLLPAKEFARRVLPVNDSDCEAVNLGHLPKLHPRRGLSDMTFSNLFAEAMICSRELSEVPESPPGDWTSWNEKIRIVTSFEKRARTACAGFERLTNPFAKVVASSAEDLILEMNLLVRRPASRSSNNPIPPWDQFSVLQCTTEIIERFLMKVTDSSFAQWAWYFETWPKWHILGALLAELCVTRDDELADRAYMAAKQGYDYCAANLTTSDLFPIWKSIKKLMKRVEGVRSAVVSSVGTQSSNFSQNQDLYGSEDSSNGVASVSDTTGLQGSAMLDVNYDWTSMNMLNQPLVDMTQTLPDSNNDALWANWDTFLQDMGNTWEMEIPKI